MLKRKSLRLITVSAMMIALSVVIGTVCKNFFTFGLYYRITFENLPIMVLGLLFGPVPAGISAVIADFISCMASGGGVNPIISLGACSVGVISGLFSGAVRGSHSALSTALAVALSHLIGQVGIKSIGKMVNFGMPWYGVFIGLGISLFVGIAEFFIIRRVLFGTALFKKYGDLK